MEIQENISLKPYNSFRINAKARYFAFFSNTDELEQALDFGKVYSKLVIGGGSNILFTKDIDGLVLKNGIKGINELHEDSEFVYVKAGAGENWHRFVLHCINKGWGGIENLSLIPGNVGASPMQNIGAYGVEVDEVFWSLEAYSLQDKKIKTFTKTDCEFGYRESVFKKKYKDQFVILTVTLQLRKRPRFNTSYGVIEQELDRMGVKELSLKAISDAVINIRSSKLPDPVVLGNAGSFFKNPVVDFDKCQSLQSKFPGIIVYPTGNNKMKLAAGWLIEQCGWKGQRKGDAGCHEKQALVLVNFGNAKGNEILRLSEEIIESVKQKFDVLLEREVNIL
jgi:UDP-N-acetylmuramate dehydrogenase